MARITGFAGGAFVNVDQGGDAAFIGPSIGNLSYVINSAITPVDFSTRFTGTGLTFAAVGSLPTGLSLNASGVLSGTPTVEQVASGIVIRATDASLGTADSNAFNITISDVVLAVYPRWMPLILAERISWLRRYDGLRAAAISEAAGAAQWAKYALFLNVKVDVHSVPGYPRPNWPVPGG
jgi:putative Ig domain-containing protein